MKRLVDNRFTPWIVSALLLIAAWLIAVATPATDDDSNTFAVTASLGTRAEGRNIAATFHDVRAAHAITGPDGWRAEGTWVVVDLDVEAVVSQYGTSLGLATLTVDDDVYRATERGESGLTLLDTPLVPGIPKTGSLAFQLPDDALTGTATLRIAATSDPVYDSTIVLPISLDELDTTSEIALVPVDWTKR